MPKHIQKLERVPYKAMRGYGGLSERFYQYRQSELRIDIAVYPVKTADDAASYRKPELKIIEPSGLKTQITDPQNMFCDLYEKTLPAVRGLGRHNGRA